MYTHEPYSVALFIVCTFNKDKNELWYDVGKACVSKLLIKINELAEQCIEDMKKNEKMIMSDADYDNFNDATCCHICKKIFARLNKYGKIS